MTSTAAKQALEPAIVTKAELVELRECEEDYKKAAVKVSQLEKQRDILFLGLVEKVLGLKSKDELKVLPLEKVQRLYAKRQAAGLWEFQKGAPAFAFELTSARRYPAWKDLYTLERGEAAAKQRAEEADLTHSYRAEVTSPL